MRKALIKILIYTLILLLFFWGMQFIVDSGLRKSKMQNFAPWNDLFYAHMNCNLLILGGSRAKLIISPKILDSALKTNSYNYGINGGFFPIQNALFKAYLKHNPIPQYIVQNVDFTSFTHGTHLSNSDQFLPYRQDTDLSLMSDHYDEKFTLPEKYLPFFKYNNHLNLVKEGILCSLNKGKRATNNLYKGYGPMQPGTFDSFFAVRMSKDKDFVCNNIEVNVFDEFENYIKYCVNNNIKLIFVYVPILAPYNKMLIADSSNVTRKLEELAQKYQIPYISYLTDSICYNKLLFADHIHLNRNGSQYFNQILARDLARILRNRK